MGDKEIKATGNFLATYSSELKYIQSFQNYKNEGSSYIESIESFYKFFVEFKVIRSIVRDTAGSFLDETIEWVNGSTPDDVDGFSLKLFKTGLTHEKVPVSMASKILFLWIV